MSTRAQILAEIAAQFPDNTTGLITPAKLRQVCEDLANSSSIPETDGTIAAAVAAHNTSAGAHLNIVRTTLGGGLTLTAADSPQQRIIPDADRDVVLPAESTAQWQFVLCHAGASYNIRIKRAGGTTVGVLIPGSVAVVAWDGTGFGLC